MSKIGTNNMDEMRKMQMYDIEEKARFLNPPTYGFEVGDLVKFGGFSKSVIYEKLRNGLMYGLVCESSKPDGRFKEVVYRVAAWTDIRPLENCNTKLATNQDIRLAFDSTSIDGVLCSYYSFGFNGDTEYQRGYVWEHSDRESLIGSIFSNIDIGNILLIRNDYGSSDYGYDILDGKQRLNAIIGYYENRFAYKGYKYNDLSSQDKRVFDEKKIGVAKIEKADRKTILKYFIMANTAGKVMDNEHLRRAVELYEKL